MDRPLAFVDDPGSVRHLYLLRHAKSSWDDPGLADHERPLAPRGRRAAKRLRRYVEEKPVHPTLVLCSSAVRARETVSRIGTALGTDARIEVEDELYWASSDELLVRLRRLPDETASVMLVGHNPGLQELAHTLVGPTEAAERFPTGALATIAVEGSWRELAPGGAELVDLVVPREL